MGVDRRKFLKVAGLTALAAAGKPLKALADSTDVIPEEKVPSVDNYDSPLTAKRWAMVIDLKKCREKESCQDCMIACHKSHNVPEFDNPKDEIKWIWKEKFEHAFHEQENEYLEEAALHSHIPLLCNHCDHPPCAKVCPTNATWKREEDGIVMMDWHRCIGCRYCIAACPYGSRSFNWRDPRSFIDEINPDYPTRMRGVVEKCTFCDEQLAVGKPPLCVAACKEGAMAFGDLEDAESDVRKLLQGRFSIRRKTGLGTQPEVYYLV